MKRGIVGMFVIWSTLALLACGTAATPAANPAAATPEETSCDFAGTGATIAVDGKRANFACPKVGESNVVLLGDIKVGDKSWQIQKAVVNMTDRGFTTKSTETVPVRRIELADGSSCAFAGTGTTITIDGKRANFTCGRQGDNDVVLLGDIKEGDKGWQIERAVINMTSKSFAGTTEAMTIKAISVGSAEKR